MLQHIRHTLLILLTTCLLGLTAGQARADAPAVARRTSARAAGHASDPGNRRIRQKSLCLLYHWDNLNGSIDRGFAGRSIFWSQPHTRHALTASGAKDCPVCQHIVEYGRRNQELGINGVVLNNENDWRYEVLTEAYLDTTRLYADLLRPFGIKVYLNAYFGSPVALSAMPTADPLDIDVMVWWQRKASQLYRMIPDFGGYMVKTSQEDNMRPMDYGRTHADGANMLARSLANHGGIVLWNAFVYGSSDVDRARQAYLEFKDLDGRFDDNVVVVIKNGPVDFQPREPIHPLFYAMPHTNIMAQLEITQEYLGSSNHIVYLGTMWYEFFADLRHYQADGHLPPNYVGTMGVANIGDCAGPYRRGWSGAWCGNLMAEANWYAFARLAHSTGTRPQMIVQDWIDRTFPTCDAQTRTYIAMMLMMSREAAVDYMTPIGLHHLMAWGHHYGPQPWSEHADARPDWLPTYYHRAAADGLGFDRTQATGSNAVGLYPKRLAERYETLDKCPEELLLWFHHVPWDYKRRWTCGDRYIAYTPSRLSAPTEETLWEHLCRHYQNGVETVQFMQMLWDNCRHQVPYNIYSDIMVRLETQRRDAEWWRDACLLYFQQFSHMPFPEGYPKPLHDLDFYKQVDLGITNYENPTPELLDSKR